MRQGTLRRYVAAVVIATCVVACRRQPELLPTPLPDLSRLDPALQRQVRDRHAALAAIASAPAAERARAFGEVGRLLLAIEHAEAAEPFFANARLLDTADLRWPYYLGHVHTAKHHPEQAAAFFEEARQRDPAHVPSLLWLAESYLALGRPADALPHLNRAVELQPSSVAAWFRRGRAAAAAGNYTQAVNDFERALALDPGADAVHYQLGLAYRALGDGSKAQPHLQRRGDAASIVPADPLMDSLAELRQTSAGYLTRGLEALDRREWPAAVEHLRKASALAPDDGTIQLNLGTALYLSGDAAGARHAFDAAVRLSPSQPKPHYTLGLLAEAEFRDAEAIQHFTTAVRLDPRYLQAHASLADALRRTGRVETSLEHYARVLALDPAAAQARFGYAMGLVRLGRYREAREWLEKAVALHPDQPGFAHALARLLAAAPDERVRDGRAALRMIDGLLESNRAPALSETMAMALAEVGRFDEAVRWQLAAIDGARQAGQAAAAARMQDTLARYQRRQPARTPWVADDPVHTPRPAR